MVFQNTEEMEPEDKEKAKEAETAVLDDVMLETDDIKAAEDGGEEGEKTAAWIIQSCVAHSHSSISLRIHRRLRLSSKCLHL